MLRASSVCGRIERKVVNFKLGPWIKKYAQFICHSDLIKKKILDALQKSDEMTCTFDTASYL